MIYDKVVEIVSEAKTILLTGHENPDADCVGSMLALYKLLNSLGKEVSMVAFGQKPKHEFLANFEKIKFIKTKEEAQAVEKVDLLLSCDCGDIARLNIIIECPHEKTLNIDHHINNDCFADVNLVEEVACTGLIIEKIFSRYEKMLDKEIATCLYAALVGDTGRFMHSNTTTEVFLFASRLLDYGIDANKISSQLSYTKTVEILKIEQRAIQNLFTNENNSIAGVSFSQKDIDELGKPNDWGELSDLPRSLIGNKVSFVMREFEGNVKISLRSNQPYEILSVAQKLSGGGHYQAAGCTIKESTIDKAKNILIPLLEKIIN